MKNKTLPFFIHSSTAPLPLCSRCYHRLVKHSYCNTLINMLYDPYAFHTVLRYVGPITVFCGDRKPRPQRGVPVLKPPWVPASVKDVYTSVTRCASVVRVCVCCHSHPPHFQTMIFFQHVLLVSVHRNEC